MSWETQYLWEALDVTAPYNLDAAAGGVDDWDFPSDWSISGVAGLVEVASGPYDQGEIVQIEMTFTGAGQHHDQISTVPANYTFQGSSGGEITTSSKQTAPTLEYQVDSDAADGTYTVYATYDEAYNTQGGASGMGVQQSIDLEVVAYKVTLTASAASDTEINLNYEIESGVPDYNIEIYRKLDSDASYPSTPIHTDTHTSDGTYSHTDGGLDQNSTYDYMIECTENGGSGRTVSDTAQASPIGTS